MSPPRDGLDVRPSASDEADAIAALLNDHARDVLGEPATSAAEVAYWLGLPDVESWVAEAPGGSLVAHATLREEAERTRFWLHACEHPRRREAGGAAALLAVAERRARARAAPGALLRPVVSTADGPLAALYAASGYRLVRHVLEMRIELAGDLPHPAWPPGFTLRTFVPGRDERRVYAVDMEAFEDHWEFVHQPFAAWRTRLLGHPTYDPRLWFLLEDGDELAGICLCGPRPTGDPTFGWVTVLAVRRGWRRRGLGLALLRHGFRALRERGMTRAGLSVDGESLTGAVRLYERAGMRAAVRDDVLEKPLAGGTSRQP